MTVPEFKYAVEQLRSHRKVLLGTKSVLSNWHECHEEDDPTFKSAWCDERIKSIEAAIKHLEECPAIRERKNWAMQLFHKKG